MAGTYRDYMAEICPPWLLTRSGQPFVQAIGEEKDALMYRMFEAVRIRFPRFGTSDSLAAMGFERGIPRAVGESIESYAGRVRGAWASWAYGGTALGILRALYDSGYTNVHLAIFNGKRYTLDGSRNLVASDLDEGSWKFRTLADTYWSRFIVLFPKPYIARWIADGVPGSSSDEANLIRSLIRRWKPVHMQTEKILISTTTDNRLLGFYPAGETMGTRPGTLGTRTPWTSWTP